MILDFSLAASIMAIAVIYIFYRLPMSVQNLILRLSVISECGITYILWRMHDHGVTGTFAAAVAGLIVGGVFEGIRAYRGVKTIW